MTTNHPNEVPAETVDDLTDAELLQLRRFLSPATAIEPAATPGRPALPVRRLNLVQYRRKVRAAQAEWDAYYRNTNR
jgi:hypothetical protein